MRWKACWRKGSSISTTGNVEDKRGYIDSLKSALVRYYIAFDRTEVGIKVFESATALVSGKVRIEGELNGERKAFVNRIVTTWVRFADGWKLIVSQSTPLPAG